MLELKCWKIHLGFWSFLCRKNLCTYLCQISHCIATTFPKSNSNLIILTIYLVKILRLFCKLKTNVSIWRKNCNVWNWIFKFALLFQNKTIFHDFRPQCILDVLNQETNFLSFPLVFSQYFLACSFTTWLRDSFN